MHRMNNPPIWRTICQAARSASPIHPPPLRNQFSLYFVVLPISTTVRPSKICQFIFNTKEASKGELTRWQTLLQLLRLFRVIEGQCVEVSRAPNFELCLLLSSYCLGGDLLYACLYFDTSNRGSQPCVYNKVRQATHERHLSAGRSR